MAYEDEFVIALKEMISRAGSQKIYADSVGIAQSRISEYLNRKITLDGISFGMLLRLFPDLQISFLGSKIERKTSNESKPMEEELLSLFRHLSPKEQARCLLIIGAYFGESIKE